MSLPGVSGGVFTDYFFDFDANLTVDGDMSTGSINSFDTTAGKFGGASSGVIIDPLSVSAPDTEKDKTINVDLVSFKNNIILQAAPRGGTLPMEQSRFNSQWQHAQNRPEYSSVEPYFDGSDDVNGQSLVKREDNSPSSGKSIVRFFKYIGTNNSTAADPISIGQSDWFEDFTVIPAWSRYAQYDEFEVVYTISGGAIEFWELDSGETAIPGETSPVIDTENQWSKIFNDIPESQHEPFFSYTPWTSDFLLQKANLSDTQIPESGYVGVVPDWNFERANFDRVNSENQFEQVSAKAVVRAEKNSANIPSAEIVNGARFLINGVGAGDFAGEDNEVAEWFQPPQELVGEWKFSKASSDFETNEVVTDLNTGQIWGWSGGSWSVLWDPTASNGTSSSAFHAVHNGDIGEMGFGLIGGATQIPGQAIRLKYNWNQFDSFLNLSSRGAWWVQHLPMPRVDNIDGSGRTLGDIYANSTLDTTNLDINRLGQLGWNNGLDSEDLGRISALTMKVRLSIEDVNGDLVHDYANMPFTGWAIDVFGRIWSTNFTVRRNGQYSRIRLSFGDRAPQKLYHNRIDELFNFYGFTFSQNFFLKEKQFSGVEFDWRFVKSWGIFWNVAYDDNGMYIGVRDQFVETLSQWAQQIGNFALSKLTDNILPAKNLVIDHVFLDIDELAFEKQLIVNSDDSAVSTARTEIAHEAQETDYLNAKGKAQGMKERKKFINQAWFMKSHGDVRLRLGQLFKAIGSRVPEQDDNYSAWNIITGYDQGDKVSKGGFVWQSRRENNVGRVPETNPDWWQNLNELVCAEVKHIIDNDGYMTEITGVRKFIFDA